MTETPGRVCSETADLLYHLWVLLLSEGLTPDDVYRELARRRKGI